MSHKERYVLAISPERMAKFEAICLRERAPFAIVGEATAQQDLQLTDRHFENVPIDMPLDLLLGKPPKMHREVQSRHSDSPRFKTSSIDFQEACERVLRLPCVADKSFLITIGDRSVTGLVARDQMVGPWQVPVADCAVTASSYDSYHGEAMAMGERPPVALLDHAASARLAVAESILNLAATDIGDLKQIKLSANWMSAAGHPGEDAGLYQAVKAVGEALCPELELTIPVGKDSMSMKTTWQENGETKANISPMSLVITAFARVEDIRKTITPQLRTDRGETRLLLIDLANQKQRLGASALAQVYQQLGDIPADLDDPKQLKAFFYAMQSLIQDSSILAYHDKSDGGLFVTIAEMAFAGHTGVTLDLEMLKDVNGQLDPLAALFNEELGAVIQVSTDHLSHVHSVLMAAGLGDCVFEIGQLNGEKNFKITVGNSDFYQADCAQLHGIWSETSYRMQALRDNPNCAEQEFQAKQNYQDPGLFVEIGFDLNEDIAAPYIATGIRPSVAILREQGVNSQSEMAAAFDRAGFDAIDVHMSDLLSGRHQLANFIGLAACGGFSYGDVLGAGGGWAKTILLHEGLKRQFQEFFERDDTFSLGVCNGCQMLSHLKALIPGASHWPQFVRNNSEQFEARFSLVEVQQSPSIFLTDMAGSRMPIAVSHGEGRVQWSNENQSHQAIFDQTVALKFVDHFGQVTEAYPFNPNGSPQGITGLTTKDGRVTIMMPHPERVIRTVSNSWHPDDWQDDSPWMRMFRNARKSVQ